MSGGELATHRGQCAACWRLWLCVGGLLEALGGGKVELAVDAFALVIVRVVETLLRRPRVQSQRRDVWRRARHDVGKRKRLFQIESSFILSHVVYNLLIYTLPAAAAAHPRPPPPRCSQSGPRAPASPSPSSSSPTPPPSPPLSHSLPPASGTPRRACSASGALVR